MPPNQIQMPGLLWIGKDVKKKILFFLEIAMEKNVNLYLIFCCKN